MKRLRSTRSAQTVDQYYRKPKRFRDMYEKVLRVLAKMRVEKTSLQNASRESSIDPRTVKNVAGSAPSETNIWKVGCDAK